MTLIISTLTSAGIVVSADSRQTYRNTISATRIGSDSATKLFKLTDRCGVAIAGRAFISENNQPMKSVGYFVRRFVREHQDMNSWSIKETAERINGYLAKIFIQREIEAGKNRFFTERSG